MKPTFTFQVTLHPAQKCRIYAGSHTILFTHGVITDGQAIEDTLEDLQSNWSISRKYERAAVLCALTP